MPSKKQIEVGKKINRLTILKESNCKKHNRITLVCKCDCGNIIDVTQNSLYKGNTKSCGCIRIEKPNHTTHNLRDSSLYNVWANIKQRCYNEKFGKYSDYGGRGIIVCDEWKNDFLEFYNWCIVNGYKKGLEIDRKNNDGNYEPNNCHFVTRSGNMRNTRANVVIEYNGKKKTMKEWAIDLGIPYMRLQQRIGKLRMPIDRALNIGKLNRFDKI